jgi:hypothetical protein
LILGRSSSLQQVDHRQSPLDRPGVPRKSPCSGLSCSNRVPMPVSSITPLPDGRDRWCALGVVMDLDDTSIFCRATDAPPRAPTGHRSSIFHPPRV